MDLELLSPKRKNKYKVITKKVFLLVPLFCLFIVISPLAMGETIVRSGNAKPPISTKLLLPNAAKKTYSNYLDLQQHVLELMRSAKRRIWLTSRYLNDDEVVLGLYVARYRRVDIRVGVSKSQAMSRGSKYQALKNENIHIRLLNLKESTSSPSSLVVDDKGYRISTNFDPTNDSERFELVEVKINPKNRISQKKRDKIPTRTIASNPWRKDTKVLSSKNAHVSREIPKVAKAKKMQVFDYSGIKTKRPEHVETKLPKVTKWSKNRKKNKE